MAYNIIRPKDRTEWLTHRTQGIGSSEVATLLGLNPWETPYQLWRRKMGLDAPKETFAMRAGHYLEDAVAQFWKDETGRDIIKVSAGDWLIINQDHPYLRVSPDRTYWLSGEKRNAQGRGILECKTTQKSIDADDLPKHWFCQLQYQLGVAELEQGSLAWLTAGREFGYKDIALVPDFYAWIKEEVERFWTDNIVGGREPEAQSAEDVIIKYERHTEGLSQEATLEQWQTYQDLRGLKEQIAQLEEKKKQKEDALKMAIGEAEQLSYQGQTLATFRSPKPSKKLDAKALQSAHPEICLPFIKEQQGARRFLLKS